MAVRAPRRSDIIPLCSPALNGTTRSETFGSSDTSASRASCSGMTRVYSAACTVFGVISVGPGLTVSTNGRVLLWHFNGVPDTYPAADVEAAAERLATLATSAADLHTFRDGER